MKTADLSISSVSSLATSLRDALNGTINALSEAAADPKKASLGALLLVQTSPALHQQLAAEAVAQEMSLNDWANLKLTLPARAVLAHTIPRSEWHISTDRPFC